ncbi:MAG: hypothetical protein QNJ46_21390 [Leptolyngbyaceae cyanobacterium MO_188.B28]|nr:hypothetical protein [Leptolyngbyaceae cyanobacterium MO_188.B28]
MVSLACTFAQWAQVNCCEMTPRRFLATSVGLMGWFCIAPQAIAGEMPRTEAVSIAQVFDALPPPPSEGGFPASLPAEVFSQRYLVFVNGDSPLLLEQVQRVEPGAFRRKHEGRTVIQAGLFSLPQNAQQQRAQLASQGIGAEIEEVEVAVAPPAAVGPPVAQPTSLPPTPTDFPSDAIPIPVMAAPDNSVEFGQPPDFAATAIPPPPSGAFSNNSPYYVVIPGASHQLDVIRNQVLQLGGAAYNVQIRERPRGPHVSVGPFESRRTAENWNDYLRESGLNSRVFFDR